MTTKRNFKTEDEINEVQAKTAFQAAGGDSVMHASDPPTTTVEQRIKAELTKHGMYNPAIEALAIKLEHPDSQFNNDM